MQEKPYFCPNCRSNRVKFSVISSISQPFLKDAVTGVLTEVGEQEPLTDTEPTIQCLVCSFSANELRFIKQAEREPRAGQPLPPSYQ
ncbi:hypothetical protein [Paenibacillus mucilaginosus]|uniref:Uncharacterized protein n=1 Tax=Paenibacillus mucilaginosus (strain KNP414) TaxID=1036673 RepID=F8F9M7_PAEMK|nr:hypothetical protein [Paenibacillus mucilaginosus]AEI44356.1 hypothetical protein KNP414_05832 [Paenibacillus mucilaginosus KNP414]MCG7217590.1 hypothetical protein [Paenibacillus mucilaginosus]WDM25752.1 hypothetical protein KCX80_25340 [Paenibacillus mucilaginosus]